MKIYTDGASRGNPGPSACAYITEDGTFGFMDIGKATNNIAEYRAVIMALQFARDQGYSQVEIVSDSMLVVKQMNREYRINSQNIRELYLDIVKLEEGFDIVKYVHVPRTNPMIQEVDKLCNKALDRIPRIK